MKHSELILNQDGSIYHLNLLPGELAPTIILVGDPGRVEMVSKYFHGITLRKSKREFITHTGYINDMPVSVISTGIGTDNIDIVMNEVDALFNVDFETRKPRTRLTSLSFIRIGTCGGIQEDTPVDSFILSSYALGLDAMSRMEISHTDETSQKWYEELMKFTDARGVWLQPAYMTCADEGLVEQFSGIGVDRVAVTCAGFYGLQGRSIRLESTITSLLRTLQDFEYAGIRVGCLEMESAAIYLFARLLGHKAVSLNAVIANRNSGVVSNDPYAAVDQLIRQVLRNLAS